MRALELFSGAGGLAKGLEFAGFQHVSFIENNKDACDSLRKNFNPEIVYQGDVSDFDLLSKKDIEIISGGPPCQPFSLGGKHQANEDVRDLFPQAIRFVEYYKPKAFIFENVKGLLRGSFSSYFEYILMRLKRPSQKINFGEGWRHHLQRLKEMDTSDLEEIRYNVSYKLINAADYGVPQKRERVIIVGIRSDLDVEWEFPKPTHSEDRLNWDKYVTGAYWKRHGLQPKENELILKKLKSRYGFLEPEHLPWLTIRDALVGIPHPLDKHSIEGHEFKAGARIYPGHTGSHIDEPSKTIKAGGHGVPGGENMIRYEDGAVRYFTSYEAKLIQTFPHDFIISGAWGEAMRQIGNAVPVKFSELLGQHLLNTLNR